MGRSAFTHWSFHCLLGCPVHVLLYEEEHQASLRYHFKMSAYLVKTLSTYVAVDSACRIFVFSELSDRDILIRDMDCTVSCCSKQAEAGNNNIGSPTTVPTGKTE